MYVARLSGLNSVNSSQNSKKTPYRPNFGLFILADAEAGEALVKKVSQCENYSFVGKLLDLIEASKSEKGIVYTDGKALVKAYSDSGSDKPIYKTKTSDLLLGLLTGLESIVKGERSLSEIPKGVEEITSRLEKILKDCPIGEKIEEFLSTKPPSPVTDPVSGRVAA
jgi:hypothetical protein